MRLGMKILLGLLVLSAVAMLVVAVMLWWPNLIYRFLNAPALPAAALGPAQAQQILVDDLKNYTDRVSDLEKLISVLLGLSAIYTISLGLSSWVTVQTNLQQAEKWVLSQQELLKGVNERAEKSVQKLEALLLANEQELANTKAAIAYAIRIPSASASLALALQGKYVSDADLAIQKLLESRSTHGTDRYVNLYLGRLYRALGRFQNAAEAMTSYIHRKEQAGDGDDKDTVDAYYNRACYQSLCWTTAKLQEEKEILRAGIERDVKRLLSLNQTLKADINGDGDFDPVRGEGWFAKLL
jgi:hypothetical protein